MKAGVVEEIGRVALARLSLVRARCVGINPLAWTAGSRVRQAPYVTCRTFPTVLWLCRNAEHIIHPKPSMGCVLVQSSGTSKQRADPAPVLSCLAK